MFIYNKYKNRRNLTFAPLICFFVHSTLYLTFLVYQVINGYVYYFYNILLWSKSVVEVLIVTMNVFWCLAGISLAAYFKDVFFLIGLVFLEVGYLVEESKKTEPRFIMSRGELVTAIVVISFSFVCALYTVYKYRLHVCGFVPIEEDLDKLIPKDSESSQKKMSICS